MHSTDRNAPIGMFDSGVGGISVLREAVKMLPHERFIFFGDTRNAPYGTKTKKQVLSLSENVVAALLQQGVKAIVIACNTATSAAAAVLRERYALPIIGMEPALKPASQLQKNGIVLSLATPGTIAGEKYALLMSQYGNGVVSLPCPGLMEFAERGEMESTALHQYLAALFMPYVGRQVDAIVLGCTHYVFLKKAIGDFYPDTPLIDGNIGTVQQLIRRLKTIDMLAETDQVGCVDFQTSGEQQAIDMMKRLYSL